MWHVVNLLGWFLVPKGLWKKDQEPQHHPHTQDMSRQGRVVVLEVEQHPVWISCFSLGAAPHCNTKAPISRTSGVRHPRPQRQVLAGCLSHRGGLREIRKPVLARGPHSQSRVTAYSCPAATSRTSQPLPDYHLPSPTNGRGTGTPQTRQPTLQGRRLDISPPRPSEGPF